MEQITNKVLTGKYRFKKTWFGIMLWVQYSATYTSTESEDSTTYTEDITRWRKATMEDIKTLNFKTS